MKVITKFLFTTLLCALGIVNASAQDEEIALTANMFYNWDGYGANASSTSVATVDFNVGNDATLGGGAVVCGTGTVDYLIYADLTGSTKILFEGTPGVALRVLMNRQESNNGPLVERNPTIGEDGKAELDVSDLDYVHVNAIKTGWGSASGKISSIKFVKPADPLAIPKEALTKAIAHAKMQSPFAKTEASFAALQTAIDAGQAALAAADATLESLTAAKTAIENAEAALELTAGFENLTKANFLTYANQGDATGTANPGCAYELFVGSGLPYGLSTVDWLNYANLSAYDKLYVTVANGAPRFCFNRLTSDGQDNDDETLSKMIDIPGNSRSTETYQTKDGDNIYVIDLAKMVQNKGFAYLHSIKGANYGSVTVTGMYLSKKAITPAYGTIWSEETGEKTVENDFTIITLDNAYFKDFAKVGDTIRVNISKVGNAASRARRIITEGTLRLIAGDEAQDVTVQQGTTVQDFVINDALLAAINAGNTVYLRYKYVTVASVELLELVVPAPILADDTYYILNKATQKYLAAGNSWGTHAIVNDFGLDYVAKLADGKYTLDSNVSNGGNNHFLNDVWNDGAAFGWTIEKVGDYFTISNGTNYLAPDGNNVVQLVSDATADAAQWQFITAADRRAALVAAMENATAQNPVDVTLFVKAPDFNRNDLRNSAWVAEKSGGNQTIAGPNENRGTFGCESWNNTFDIYQNIENLPEGVYEFSVSGYGTNGTTVIYANETEAPFVNVESAANFRTALDSIAKGGFAGNTTGKANVLNGTLKIGVKRTSQVGQDWTVFDKAVLTYYGPVSSDEFKTAYETALAAAQAALANEDYAIVTGEERTALEQAIADNKQVEDNADAYKAATIALNNATSAFTGALSAYKSLADAKTLVATYSFEYAAAEKKAAAEAAAAVTATNAADATAKKAALLKAYRQYAESSALLEGIEGATDKTELIVNPAAEEPIAEPWTTILGEGSGGSLGVLSNEPWTDGNDNAVHKYFDGGNWGASAWDVALKQEIQLPAGKYQLTAKSRSSMELSSFNLFAGEEKVEMIKIGAAGGLFDRGWNDNSIVFDVHEAATIAIGVQGVTTTQYNWMSFSDFRLVRFPSESDGIKNVESNVQKSDVIYNLSGQRVEKTAKGLYIINGKKVVLK